MENTTSMTQSITTQAAGSLDKTIAMIGDAVHGLVVGWNALPESSQWLLIGLGILLLLLRIRRSFRLRKLVRVNRAMAATLDDPFYKDVTLKTGADYERA